MTDDVTSGAPTTDLPPLPLSKVLVLVFNLETEIINCVNQDTRRPVNPGLHHNNNNNNGGEQEIVCHLENQYSELIG